MASIRFLYTPVSPPCRMVEMVANMAGVTLNKQLVNLLEWEHKKGELLKLNPLQKLPFIIDGDLRLNESRAISTYLVNKYMPENNTLYPRDAVKRAKVDELLHIDSGNLSPASFRLLSPKMFRAVEKLNPVAEKNYREIVSYIDGRVRDSGSKFILSDHITLADISLAATFSQADFSGYDLSEFKNLTDYLSRLEKSIPKYKEINEEPIAMARILIESIQTR